VKILKSKDLSRPGNDCYIYEKISLVEEFDMYAVIVCEKVTGWAECKEVRVDHISTDYQSALKYFNEFVAIHES
jgi:hypothetical protein